MRRFHFETLRPVCPRCRADRGVDAFLALASVEREERESVLEGILCCPDPACRMEYPIVDGIPILVPDVRGFVAENLAHLLARDDLGEVAESLLGDCAGPGSVFDTARQHLSIYGAGHWDDRDPEGAGAAGPADLARCLGTGLEILGEGPGSPALDLGCSVGRTAFEIAARTEGPVLGLDLSVPMLRVAQAAAREGRIRYPRRRVGLVYDRREFAHGLPGAERVDFWCADAHAPPFPAGTFGFASALNLLDCAASPLGLIRSLAALLRPGAGAILATPWDWSPNATRVEAWLGGHSQRGPGGGASEPILRALLTPGAHPQGIPGLVVAGEEEGLPWRVRLHDRSTVEYRTHLLAIRRQPG